MAIGESVMLGAKPVLDARGITTVAEVSKGPDWELQQLQLAKTKYRLITKASSSNWARTAPSRAISTKRCSIRSATCQRVVMLTVKAPKPWIAGNNEIIRSLPETHPNVVVLDWEARAAEISGHLSGSDGGVHLSDDTAKQFYRDIILEALGPTDLTRF